MTTPQPFAAGAELYCAMCERQFEHGELCPDDGTRLVRIAGAVDPLIGRELDGRFTVVEKLGEGGVGAVYRARQHSVGREVAIKVLAAAMVSNAASIKRFLREATLASRLAHPNTVAVLDFGQTRDGVLYLVMELVEGETLQALLAREHRLELPRFMRIALQLCDALDGAHALSLVHRDLKPANIMVLAQGRDLVKVLDFGLAKSLSLDRGTGTTTNAGMLLGTPMYMPPEIANGLPADGRADLYSLGCVLYVMGSGRPPFDTASIPEMIAMHASTPAPPMSGVPLPIAGVVDRLLQKDPAHRFQTAADLRSALEEAYQQARMTPQPPPGVPAAGPPAANLLAGARPQPAPSDRRRTRWFVASALLAAGAGTLLLIVPSSTSDRPAGAGVRGDGAPSIVPATVEPSSGPPEPARLTVPGPADDAPIAGSAALPAGVAEPARGSRAGQESGAPAEGAMPVAPVAAAPLAPAGAPPSAGTPQKPAKPAKRPPRKKPGVPARTTTAPPTTTLPAPTPGSGAGSSVRPGAGSSAPF